MALNDALLNVGADAMASAVTQLTLHSADPGGTGTNQVGVQPATFTGNTGDIVLSAAVGFTGLPTSGPITHVGLRGAADEWYGAYALTGDQAANAAGEYTVGSGSITGSST